jgi:hypothetical protein
MEDTGRGPGEGDLGGRAHAAALPEDTVVHPLARWSVAAIVVGAAVQRMGARMVDQTPSGSR